MAAFWRKFSCGSFGTLLLLLVRGLPPIPWLARYASTHWGWIGLSCVLIGGMLAVLWGDDNRGRAFYFGLTWPPLLAALIPR